MDTDNMKGYEVVLDNCDGTRLTVWVWENGRHTITKASNTVARDVGRMVRRYWRGSTEEAEAPPFVHAWAEKYLSKKPRKHP